MVQYYYDADEMEVTPRAGVWIETTKEQLCNLAYKVTPRAGVWIETITFLLIF